MKNATHTPGIWELRGSRLVADSNGIVIAENVGANHPGAPKANACLIASAPDLLEALQAAVESMEAVGMPQEWNCLPLARAAIAKARGNG